MNLKELSEYVQHLVIDQGVPYDKAWRAAYVAAREENKRKRSTQ